MRTIMIIGGLASLVAANPNDDYNSLRGAEPLTVQKKGSGVVFETRRLHQRGRVDKGRQGDVEKNKQGLERGKDDESSAFMSREYMGCFGDDKGDRVMGYKLSRDDMTTEICRGYCMVKNSGHMYYGTQFGSECWCGMSDMLADYDRHGTGICDYPCAGNSLELCGGHSAFDLYRYIDVSSPSVTPEPTPGPTPTSVQPTPVIPTQTSGTMESLLDLHNDVRCMHGAADLTFSNHIASTADSYAKFLTDSDNCGEIFHSTGSGYGENLFLCGSTDTSYDCYNAELAMNGFYDDEVNDNDDVTNYGGHATQILWQNTMEVGCAVESCIKDQWRYNVLVCNYDPPGNVIGKYTEQLAKPTKSPAQCGYVNPYNQD